MLQRLTLKKFSRIEHRAFRANLCAVNRFFSHKIVRGINTKHFLKIEYHSTPKCIYSNWKSIRKYMETSIQWAEKCVCSILYSLSPLFHSVFSIFYPFPPISDSPSPISYFLCPILTHAAHNCRTFEYYNSIQDSEIHFTQALNAFFYKYIRSALNEED